MTRQVRALGIALIACFVLLFVQLNRLTVFDADQLNNNPNNTRDILRDFSQPRGTITSADGTVLARSVPSGDRFVYQREYPTKDLFSSVTGFYSFTLGSAGVEKTYNDELAGRTLDLALQDLGDLFVDKEHVGNLTLTLRNDLQTVAAQQLGQREGSVVAIDPRTGAILAMVSYPRYDPNLLANHDTEQAALAQALLDENPEKPRLVRAYQDRYFPGSTFKTVTATAGIEHGGVTPEAPSYPVTNAYHPPKSGTYELKNFGGASCGGTLFHILAVSCNTSFAQMGVETGGPGMTTTAQAYGFNQSVPIDLTNPARSAFPTDFTRNNGALAQSAIGQNNVAATPLQMAMVAGAIANKNGDVMTPHVMDKVRDSDGNVVDTYDPSVWRHALDASTASTMRDAMVGVVEDGTASRLRVEGFTVGGKTGTAQLGTTPPRSHAWIIGWAAPPNGEATIAVAVLIEGQPGASEQTGGRVAAPVAQAVLDAYLHG